MDTSFIVFGDMHLENEPSFQLLERALVDVATLSPAPSPIVFFGDMTNHGNPELTSKLRERLQSHAFTYRFVAGNHDFGNVGDRNRFTRVFGPVNYTFKLGKYTTLVIDTSNNSPYEEEWHGLVEQVALTWLRQTLERIDSDEPLLLFAHAGLVGSENDHTLDVQNAEDVLALFKPYNLKAIFHAHSHRLAYYQWHRVPAFFLPNFQQCPGYLQVLLKQDKIDVTYRVTANLGPWQQA